MERHVGPDQRPGRSLRGEATPRLERPLRLGGGRPVERPAPRALGREPGGQGVERRPNLVEISHLLGHERRDRQTLATVFDRQPLALDQLERVADRLARNAEQRRHLVLAQALAGCEPAVSDRGHQPLVHQIDQDGAARQRLQRSIFACQVVIRIRNSEFLQY